MLGNLQGWHFLIILLVILLLFGAAKLPALAKSLGQSARVFKGEIKEMKKEDEVAATPSTPQTSSQSVAGGSLSNDSPQVNGGTSDTQR